MNNSDNINYNETIRYLKSIIKDKCEVLICKRISILHNKYGKGILINLNLDDCLNYRFECEFKNYKSRFKIHYSKNIKHISFLDTEDLKLYLQIETLVDLYNDLEQENYNVSENERRIYSIIKYIPKYKFENHAENENTFSRLMWKYKDNKSDFINQLMDIYLLIELNSIIESNKVKQYIGLVCVPTSKVNKYSPVENSINRLTKLTADKRVRLINKENIECQFHDFAHMLKRKQDVHTSHLEQRTSYNEHINSIKCNKEFVKNNITYIIIDDITTTGTNLNACEEILCSNNIPKENIFKVAIAETIKEPNQVYDHFYNNLAYQIFG